MFFTNIPWEQPHHYGGAAHERILLPENRYQCDMCYVASQKIVPDEVSIIFDQLVEHLNYFLSAYILVTKDYQVYNIDPRVLESMYLYKITSITEWEEYEGILLLHTNIPFVKENELEIDKIQEIVRLTKVLKYGENPFSASILIFSDAYRFLHSGEIRPAVISAQTGVEGFITTLFQILAQGVTGNQKGKKPPFMRIVRKELPQLLETEWDIEDTKSFVGQWYCNCYTCRNRVVHEGYLSNLGEARDAIDSAYSFRLYLVQLLKKKQPAEFSKFFQ